MTLLALSSNPEEWPAWIRIPIMVVAFAVLSWFVMNAYLDYYGKK